MFLGHVPPLPSPSPLPLSHGRQHYPCHCHHQCCNRWADCHGGSEGAGRRIHQVQNRKHSSHLVQAARLTISSLSLSFTRPTCPSIPIHENICLSHALWPHPTQNAMSAPINQRCVCVFVCVKSKCTDCHKLSLFLQVTVRLNCNVVTAATLQDKVGPILLLYGPSW